MATWAASIAAQHQRHQTLLESLDVTCNDVWSNCVRLPAGVVFIFRGRRIQCRHKVFPRSPTINL
eukprot:6037004-Amphidinium_carterae.1